MNDGWVKLSDPNTGKDFYANKFTRQTQWDPPPGFVDPAAAAAATPTPPVAIRHHHHHPQNPSSTNESDLPPGWERMLDKGSGKYFYVDHANQKTSWEHPGKAAAAAAANHAASGYAGNGPMSSSSVSGSSVQPRGTATGFGFVPASSSSNGYGASIANNNSNNSNNSGSAMNASMNRSAATATASWGTNPTSSSSSTKHAHAHPHAHEYAFQASRSFTSTIDDMSSKYYSTSQSHAQSMPSLEFTIVKIPDHLRASCPISKTIFTLSKRRHHCRLCGDIFADAACSNRVLLPLSGPEYEKPVRVCDGCHADIDRGDYFSMRRYLPTLCLYDGDRDRTAELQRTYGSGSGGDTNEDGSRVESITATNVAAALTSLAQDLNAVLSDPTSFQEKVTIEADVLVPAISRHLSADETSDRAIHCLATLLALGNVVHDTSFASALFLQDRDRAEEVFGHIMTLLEWSGGSVKTLAVQEQAVKVLFYLSTHGVMDGILELEEANGHLQEEGWMQSAVMHCDVPRVLRSLLDHTTQNGSPSLQRWAAACLQNLIGEDQRRASEAVSEAMAMGMTELRYSSFMVELVSSGGIMILSSLVASEDADTRAHAMAALAQIIDAARELNVRLNVFLEAYQISKDAIPTCSETAIIEAVVSSGACGPSLAQLMLSADNASASMACQFARSLVYPILSNPLGSGVPSYHRLVSKNTSLIAVEEEEDGLKEYRQAALDIGASDGVLSALVHLVHDNGGGVGAGAGASRPVELRKLAMEILAAVSHTLAYWDGKIKNCGKSIETMDERVLQLHEKISVALTTLEEEHTAEVLLAVFTSASMNSLNTSRDSPTSQLKEASALVIAALASCSSSMADVFLMSRHVLTSLIAASADEGLDSPSYRGNWSSRRLPMLEAVASILVQGWKSIQRDGTEDGIDSHPHHHNGHSMSRGSKAVEALLESLDAGIVPLLSRLLHSRQEFVASEKVYADTRTRIAVCHCISSMFGIGRGDTTTIGFSRIFEAMGSTHRIIPQLLYLLGTIVPEVQNNASQQGGRSGVEKEVPLLQLLEANLLAVGSICGSDFCSFGSLDVHGDYAISPGLGTKEKDVFSTQFEEICVSAAEIISNNSFLPSALVGAFGEGAVMPTLRIVSTVAENGSSKRVQQQLVRSGVLLPLTDMLRDAMNVGDYYIFDACVVAIGHAGPYMNSSSENNSIRALRDCIKLFSNILAINDDNNVENSLKLVGLKKKCITAVDLLSMNSSLWTVIVAHFIPGFMDHWLTPDKIGSFDSEDQRLIRAGLRTISRVISIPTHAVFIANTGIAASLSNMICGRNGPGTKDAEVERTSIQILHTLLSYSNKKGPPTERIEPGVVDIYALDVACFLLSKDINSVDQSAVVSNTKLGLEIMLSMLVGLEEIKSTHLSQSPRVIGFVETVSSNDDFLRKLCATLLCTDFKKTNGSSSGVVESSFEPLYGSPILPFEGTCGQFARSTDAALHILFWILFYSSVAQSQNSHVLWDTFMLNDQDISDQSSKYKVISAASSIFLNLCTEERCACVPANASKLQYYQQTALPVVRERLLHALSLAAAEYTSLSEGDDSAIALYQKLLVHNRVPQLCIDLMGNPLLTEQAFEALENALSGPPGSLLQSMVSEKKSLTSLFNLLNLTENDRGLSKEVVGKIKVFSAATLSSAGEVGILGPAVNQTSGLRSFAVASLSAACLMDDHNSDTCLAEDLTEEGSSMSTLCLHGLVGVLSPDAKNKADGVKVQLSPSEAQAIASGLGKKLSSMVLERFMHKAEREHILGEISDEEAIRKFPEVTLLCALASSKEALAQLCVTGGLEALSLVAGEGELAAINALLEACQFDASLIVEVDGHVSALQVIGAGSSTSMAAKKKCYDLLIAISTNSRAGREAICNSDGCASCIDHASDCIINLASKYEKNESVKMEQLKISDDDRNASLEMEMAAISFLSSLLSETDARSSILGNGELESAIEALAKDATNYEIQQAAIVFLGSSVRYIQHAEGEADIFNEIFDTMLSIITTSQLRTKSRQLDNTSGFTSFGDFRKSHHFNENLILASTCRVMESLLPAVSPGSVTRALSALSKIWGDTLNFQMLSSKKAASKTRNSGVLMFNISSTLLLAAGRSETQELLKSSTILRDLLRFILFDPTKTEKLDKNDPDGSALKDAVHWRGALAQTLQCVAILTDNHALDHDEAGSWEELISNVESNPSSSSNASKMRTFSLSAPKTSLQSRTIKKSLEAIESNTSDSVSSIAASRILANVFR